MQKKLIFILVTFMLIPYLVCQYGLTVTLYKLSVDFNLTATGLQWIINITLLIYSSMVIFGGKVCDYYGHRIGGLISLTIFLLGSIICSISYGIIFFLIGRAVQGVGAAFLFPSTKGLLIKYFPGQEFAKAMGMYLAGVMFFMAIGPTVCGMFVEYMNWRWIFYAVIIICILLIIFLYIITLNEVFPTKKVKFDFPGIILITIVFFSLIYGIMESSSEGWTSFTIIASFLTTLISLTILFMVEYNTKDTAVNISLLKNREFFACSTALFFFQLGFTIFLVFGVLFLQHGLGYSPLMAGMLIIPAVVPQIIISPFVGKLVIKYGIKNPSIVGVALCTIGLGWFAYFADYQSYQILLPGFILFGLGAPLFMIPINTFSLQVIPVEDVGIGAGIVQTFKQIGGAIGIAVFSMIVIVREKIDLFNELRKMFPEDSFEKLQVITQKMIDPASFKILLSNYLPQQVTDLKQIAVESYIHSFSLGVWFVTLITILAGLVIIFALRNNK